MTLPNGDPNATWGGTGLSLRELVLKHETEIESLLETRSEMRGALALVKLTMGTSIVSGVVAVITILKLLSESHP